MKYLFALIVTFLLSPCLEQSFSDFLELFISGDKKIPCDMREEYLNIPLNCSGDNCPEFYARKLLFERPDKIALVYEMSCGAGGICEIQNIAIYSPEAELLGVYPFKVNMADCGFSKEQEATLISDSIFYIQNVISEIDCETEKAKSKEITLTQVNLTSRPFMEIIEKIDSRRPYWQSSTQILTDHFLSSLSKDSLDYIRNEIFASKGYRFKSERWRNTFQSMEWYTPKDNPKLELSVIEKVNVNNLLEKKNN